MSKNQSVTVTLSDDLIALIRERVSAGGYADEGEVIRDGLRALRARDSVVEAWLRDDVVPVFDRVARGEEGLIPSSEVFSGVRTRHGRRGGRSTT